MTDFAKPLSNISALESGRREPAQKWKLRKGTNPKVRQEIVEIGQQKLPIV